MMPTNLLMVDEHPLFLAGLSAALTRHSDITVAGQAANGIEALSKIDTLQPGLVVLDLSLPDIDGIELLQMIRRKSPATRLMVLTARACGDDINRALQNGAQAYLFKNSTPDDILSAIRIVSQGGRYLPPQVGRVADKRAQVADVTPRERQIIICLARGLNTSKISEALKLSADTVKTHVRNILNKLDLESRSEAVALCLKTGVIGLDDL